MSIDDNDEYAELFRKLPSGSSRGASWQDVAAEFETLGGTLGDLLRTAWQRSDGDTLVRGLRESLDSIVADLNRAADGRPETEQARGELMQLAESIRVAAAQAGDQLRPELVNLLRQANAELRRLGQIEE